MKKITKLSILLAALAFASSCQDEAGLNPPQPLEVSLSASSADTRTALDGGAVKWEKGDEVALVFTHPTNAAVVRTLSTSIESSAVSADFTGTLPAEVTMQGSEYNEAGYAVYPTSAVAEDGSICFDLPARQSVRSNGTFLSGMNLMSASVSLADLQDDGKASAAFHNALSILRFTLGDDVTSVTLTGTSPLAGQAPLALDENGRLVVTEGTWDNASNSVELRPAEGAECFSVGEVNLLVWPGAHSEMTVTLNYKTIGQYTKTSVQPFSFEPSKYYTLNLNTDSEKLVEELAGNLTDLETDLSELENLLSGLETRAEKISALVNQIQSVALYSEYLDNAVYVKYARQMYSMIKFDFQLNYIVRPAAAMELLLDLCAQEGNLSEVLSAQLLNSNGNFSSASITDAVLNGDVLTVTVNASDLVDDIYPDSYDNIKLSARLALQISDGNTELISEFAKLVPKAGAGLNITRTENVPALRGASFSMPYQYGAVDYDQCQVSVEGTGFSTPPTVTANSGTGYIRAHFNESDDLSKMSVTVTLTYDGETDSRTITFADAGVFKVATPSDVDYIGGEVAIEVTENTLGPNYTMQLNGGSWIRQTTEGVYGRYSIDLNGGSQRFADVQIEITNGSYKYTKSVRIVQKATGSPITGSYYSNGEKVLLNQKTASCAKAVNIVILGDGYQKKDLLKGGKFERSARSAMDSFFGIEPYKTFKDRFNVYMVAYESADEGVDIKSSGVSKDTYFDTYCQGGGNTAAYTNNEDKVITAVKAAVGSSDADYYRTIAIVLANTSEQAGSCSYPCREGGADRSVVGEDWKSFSICVLAANSTGTNGLVRHEAGGHAFGRLGDEYDVDRFTSDYITGEHNRGFYFNVAPNISYWNNFTNSGYGADKVTYDAYCNGSVYRSTKESGIMWNNTGVFNAVSRHAIYQRILRQTEGYSAYSWAKFLEYDKKNL